MNLISIHYGHNCTVTLSQNGKIKFAQSEERLTNIKNATGFPLQTLDYVKKKFKLNEANSEILIIDKTGQGARLLLEFGGLEPKTYQSFFKENIFKKIKRRILRYFLNVTKSKKKIENLAKINNFKINYYDHHLCHAATPCLFKDLHMDKKYLIFTIDAEGDNVSSGVYSYDKEKIKLISSNNRDKSLGYIYSYTTEILGMKSNEHEFKVMGMAPYGNEVSKKRIAEKLEKKLVTFNNTNGEFKALSNFKNFKKDLIKIYQNENLKMFVLVFNFI